ncbi:MAG: O-antigen ligase family protein, partial [Desulfuromonadaceae bacterium]
RSRGALLGLAVGMVMAVVTAPPKYRGKLMALILVAALSVLYLADDQVMDRLSTIDSSTEERDSSAQSRLDIWAGGVEMLFSNPLLGVGPGNFRTYIEIYQPEHPDRDAHNTIIRCGGELGFIGLGSFIIILFSTLKLLLGTMRDARNLDTKEGKDILWLSYGTLLGGTGMLVYGMTGTLLYTEYLWWFIAFPVSLRRALDRELELPENISVDRTA